MVVVLGALAWLILGLPVAIAIGRTIREADRRATAERRPAADHDWLADQPVEVLAPTEVERRFRQMVAGQSTRSWLA